MMHSEQLTDLLAALCAAQLNFPAITRNREGFSKRTGQRYRYADLNALIDATKPVLGQHGLLLVQALDDGDDGTLRISSTLFHTTSGQWLSMALSVEKPSNMQDLGSEATFLKRYEMQALLNVSTEEDTDAADVFTNPTDTRATKASPPASTNGHTPAPERPQVTGAHPTSEQVEGLFAMALESCHEDPDVLSTRIRQVMHLPANASTSKRLLPKTMTGEQFGQLWTYYQTLLAQLQRQTEVQNGATPASPVVASAAPAPTGESLPADPPPASAATASSSADAAERDRARLRKEVSQWQLRIKPEEQEFLITHHPYSKARQLLWGARLTTEPDAMPIEASAAD